MKSLIKRILHLVLGFEQYLYIFAIFKIRTFKWDKKESDFFQFLDMLDEDDHVLDIGSNIGITTVLMSQKVPKGKVHSFEPIPVNFITLKKITERYDCSNTYLYPYALGNENGEIEMVLPKVKNVKMQGLSHVVHEDLTEFNEGKRYKSAIYRLDDLDVLQGETAISGIKIDVENFEYFVLEGGRELIVRDQPVIYAELWDNDNRQRCFTLMRELSYKIFVYHEGQIQNYSPEKHSTQNFFFLK